MSYKLVSEIESILENQPRLTLIESADEYTIQGEYRYSLDYNCCIAQGERKIKLTVNKKFPNCIPELFIFDSPKDIEHIYQNGKVCLATIGELICFINENKSLVAFVERFVHAFLYTLDWFEKYKTYPFGDRKHGYKGALEYYLDDLGLTTEQYRKMAAMIYFNQYRGHQSCICGSGKRLRDCHGQYILPFIKNDEYKQEFLKEASSILTEDNTHENRNSSK